MLTERERERERETERETGDRDRETETGMLHVNFGRGPERDRESERDFKHSLHGDLPAETIRIAKIFFPAQMSSCKRASRPFHVRDLRRLQGWLRLAASSWMLWYSE